MKNFQALEEVGICETIVCPPVFRMNQGISFNTLNFLFEIKKDELGKCWIMELTKHLQRNF